MSTLSKRSSFLELHRAHKQSLNKLAELRRAVKLQKEQIADIEAYQQKKLRKITPPSSCAEQLAAEKRAEVARVAAIDDDSDAAWEWKPVSAPYSYGDCAGEDCWYARHPERCRSFDGVYCCVFDRAGDMQFCEVCFRHGAHHTAATLEYVEEAKRNYLDRKRGAWYMNVKV